MNLPTSDRLTLKFLVAALKKSTRHRYTPPSDRITFLICSRASLGLFSAEKYSRWPRSLASAEWVACFKEPPPLESKLHQAMMKEIGKKKQKKSHVRIRDKPLQVSPNATRCTMRCSLHRILIIYIPYIPHIACTDHTYRSYILNLYDRHC